MGEGGVIGKLAHGLAAGGGMLTAWIGANDVAVVDALAREAYDAVTLDMQHGGVDFVGATRGIRRRRAGGEAGDCAHSGRRFCLCEPSRRRRRGGGHRADDQQRRRCAPLCRVHEVPSGRRPFVGAARSACR